MKPTTDALRTFAEVAALGSFSAAARKLGRSQSTVSELIANLEIDLGVLLFDRSRRQPQLTDSGRLLHAQAREVLAAQDRFAQLADHLHQGLEPRLTIAVSDTYQSAAFESMLDELDRRHPEIELECLIAEGADVVALVQHGRAQLGLLAADPPYPPDVAAATAADAAEIGLFVAPTHALAALPAPGPADLAGVRELRINTVNTVPDVPKAATSARCWSAPSYLMLMEMAEQGFGWAPLPRWLVARYAAGRLSELAMPGWPRALAVDILWSRDQPPGPAGRWVVERLTVRRP